MMNRKVVPPLIYDLPMLTPAFMHRCLELASLGRDRVGNGALVGAVLVRRGKIIAEAFHEAYGAAHAERALLEAFKDPIEPEDVLYVNLEPCCHHGKTPPCTDIIIQRGVKTVVYGMEDPDPRVAGKGLQKLRVHGVSLIGPLERALCERLNKGFIQVLTKRRPYLTIKKAVTPDARIANDDRSSLKITSKEQDMWAQRFLRTEHDAILVGIGTVISDNPQLNIRFDRMKSVPHLEGLNGNLQNRNNFINPYRIILDPDCRIPLDRKVVSDSDTMRTILCVTPDGAERASMKVAALQARGVMILEVALDGDCFDWQALWNALITPNDGYPGMTSILVEGGARTWEAFRRAGCIDEDVVLVGYDQNFARIRCPHWYNAAMMR